MCNKELSSTRAMFQCVILRLTLLAIHSDDWVDRSGIHDRAPVWPEKRVHADKDCMTFDTMLCPEVILSLQSAQHRMAAFAMCTVRFDFNTCGQKVMFVCFSLVLLLRVKRTIRRELIYFFTCAVNSFSLKTWGNQRVCEQSLLPNQKLFTLSSNVTTLLLYWAAPIQHIGLHNTARGLDMINVWWRLIKVHPSESKTSA